jgi:hypothetical protein
MEIVKKNLLTDERQPTASSVAMPFRSLIEALLRAL